MQHRAGGAVFVSAAEQKNFQIQRFQRGDVLAGQAAGEGAQNLGPGSEGRVAPGGVAQSGRQAHHRHAQAARRAGRGQLHRLFKGVGADGLFRQAKALAQADAGIGANGGRKPTCGNHAPGGQIRHGHLGEGAAEINENGMLVQTTVSPFLMAHGGAGVPRPAERRI